MLQGLRMASRMNVRKLLVECDSKSVVRLLCCISFSHGNIDNLVQRCLEVSRDFEDVRFNHVYREQNRLADALAKQSLHQFGGLSDLMTIPTDLEDIFYEDQAGASFQRFIPRNRGGVV